MALRTHAETIKQGYINACNAVLNRGGEIETGADITSLSDAIRNIPHDTVLAYQLVDSNAYRSIVPQNAEPYSRVNKIGGKSYKTRNLLPFPYYDPTITRAGITFTVNADRSITINGSNDETANSFIYLVWRKPFKAGDYCLSIKDVNGLEAILYDGASYRRIKNTVITLSQDVDEVNIYLQVLKGSTAVFNNETIYPMLAHTQMSYEPYFEGLRDTKVTALVSEGVNLIPFPYKTYYQNNTQIGVPIEMNGITFTVNQDGSVHAVGQASKYTYFHLCEKDFGETGLYGTNGMNTQNGLVAQDCDYNPSNKLTHISITTSEPIDKTYYPMISYGNTLKPYKPYVGSLDTFAIPEEIQALEGYGKGVRSSIFNYIDYERKVFVRRVKTLVLNGTENWTADQTWNGASYLNKARFSEFAEDKAVNAAICSHYNNAAGSIYDCVQGVTLWDNYLGIYDENYNTENVTAWKEHLAELYAAGNPITITYALETPIETDISEYLADKFIEVEGGGTITAVNEHEEGVPTSATYLIETVGGAI